MRTRSSRAAASAAMAAFVFTVVAALAVFFERPASERGWAVLALGETQDDAAAVARLGAAGIEGVVSESTEWVYLDDFAGLERVPLAAYRERVEPFDPRDDGYADRLRALFVSDGTRRLFIPDVSPRRFKAITALFEGAELSLMTSARAPILPVELGLLVVAALIALAISGSPLSVVAAIPSLGVLVFSGFRGIAVAAMTVAFLRSAVDPAREAFRAGLAGARRREAPWLFDSLPAAAVFGSGTAIGSFVGGIPILSALASFAASLCIMAAGIAFQKHRREERGHARFVPVNLAPRFDGAVSASRAALPFAAAALVAFAFAAAAGSPLGEGASRPPSLPSSSSLLEGYRAHIDHQRAFSVSRLASDVSSPYGRYSVDSDGLVSSAPERDYVLDSGKVELPPAERMLARTSGGSPAESTRGAPLAALAFLLAAAAATAAPAVAMAFRSRRRGKNVESFADKRIAA